MGHGNRTMTR